MTTKRLFSALICVGLMVPSMTIAEVNKRQEWKTKESRGIMFKYAKCVVNERHDRAAQAILLNVNNDEITRNYADLIRGACLNSAVGAAGDGARMRFGGDLFRYALADALVGADLSATTETDFSNRAPLRHLEPASRADLETALATTKGARKRARIQEDYDQTAVVSWLSHYGECIVRHDPVNSKAWLLTNPDEPSESAPIKALQSAFGQCLTGLKTFTFNRVTMRGVVAINYYRLAKAPAVPAAGAAK
jgi:hypothetical protein